MDIVEVDVALLGFAGYFLSEVLSQHGFSGSNFAGYDYALRHFSWCFGCVAEVLVEKFELGVAVLKFWWCVVYVEFGFVFENAGVKNEGWLLFVSCLFAVAFNGFCLFERILS